MSEYTVALPFWKKYLFSQDHKTIKVTSIWRLTLFLGQGRSQAG